MEENNSIILFSALDWGLGHSTRSVPLLNYYHDQGFTLWIACEPGSASETILKTQFPSASYLPLRGYRISYAKNKRNFAFKIFFQIPKILRAIHREHIFVRNVIKKQPIGLIISDNRYGFYHRSVKSIFVTHQLQIAAPYRWLERWIQRVNYRHIHHFAACWVPDMAGTPNIAGKLSHPRYLPAVPVHYIGPLSRIGPIKGSPAGQAPPNGYLYTYLFLLSGPEPQRSLLENRILQACYGLREKALLIRGLPAQTTLDERPLRGSLSSDNQLPANLEIHAYAGPEELAGFIAASAFVVARSGYSTVMDLLVLRKKAILIPTPGQTEQEYLAKKLSEQKWAFCFSQSAGDYRAQFDLGRRFIYDLPQVHRTELTAFLDKYGRPATKEDFSESGDF